MDTIPQDTPQKQCSKCEKFFPATSAFFGMRILAKNGLKPVCKACRRAEYAAKHPKEVLPEGHKRCRKCKHILPVVSFTQAAKSKDGLYCYCRKCTQANWHTRHPKRDKPKTDEIPVGYKRCSICKQLLPLSRFSRAKFGKDGLRGECKTCKRRHQTRYKERERQYGIRYRKEHKEKKRVHGLQYRREHREEILTYSKQYRRTERGKLASRATHSKRKARRRAAPGTITAQQIQDKLKAQRYRCYYAACGFAKFEKVNGKYIFHLEHTIPLSRTEAEPRHDINFVVLSCSSCNLKKRDKLPHEFFEGGRLF